MTVDFVGIPQSCARLAFSGEFGSHNEHPKTGVWVRRADPVFKKETMASRPALSPECPRDAVIPPLNWRRLWES